MENENERHRILTSMSSEDTMIDLYRWSFPQCCTCRRSRVSASSCSDLSSSSSTTLSAVILSHRFPHVHVTCSSLSSSLSRLGGFCQCLTTNLIRLVLLSPLLKKFLNCLTFWPAARFLKVIASLSPLSSDLIEMSLYASNTTSTLLLPFPWRNTLDKIFSAILSEVYAICSHTSHERNVVLFSFKYI